MRENNLKQNMAFLFRSHIFTSIAIADTPLVIKVWSKVLRDSIHRLPNLTI